MGPLEQVQVPRPCRRLPHLLVPRRPFETKLLQPAELSIPNEGGNQMPSDAIRGDQGCEPAELSIPNEGGNQMPSEAIRGNQRQSGL
jgi:hypothetical protein